VSRFAAIKSTKAARPPALDSAVVPSDTAEAPKRGARLGKKVVSGHFTAEMSRALHLLAVEQGTTLQALMGEAFDDLMRKYGKHPFGER
jgi:hypothetical protein